MKKKIRGDNFIGNNMSYLFNNLLYETNVYEIHILIYLLTLFISNKLIKK
jgi:hypothetical protein